MTTNKYLKQVAEIFNMEKHKCDKEKKCLEEALKKLRDREESLSSKLDKDISDKEEKKLKKQLKIVHAQRRKGQKLLKSL
jgi:predicted  nucleic acid-binding Zn-ribbon protein